MKYIVKWTLFQANSQKLTHNYTYIEYTILFIVCMKRSEFILAFGSKLCNKVIVFRFIIHLSIVYTLYICQCICHKLDVLINLPFYKCMLSIAWYPELFFFWKEWKFFYWIVNVEIYVKWKEKKIKTFAQNQLSEFVSPI